MNFSRTSLVQALVNMGSIVCCECCGRLEVLFQKRDVGSDSEAASLLPDSPRQSSSFSINSARTSYGTLRFPQQAEAKPLQSEGQVRHDAEEDEGICGCEKIPQLSCHSENCVQCSHAFSAFHSDLPVGIADTQGPPPSLLACASPALNFAAQQPERSGAAADPPLSPAHTHTGTAEDSQGFFASLGSSFNGKGLQLTSQCARSSLDGQGMTCIVIKGINPISTVVLEAGIENPHEKLCGVCHKNITSGENKLFMFIFFVVVFNR